MDFYGKTGLPWLVYDLPSLESGAPWYRSVSNPCTHFKKSYDTVSPDGCWTLHRCCCTLYISIIRTAITSGLFRVKGAITSQNEGLSEFYGSDSFQPSMDCIMPKKDYPNLNRVSEVFYPSFFRHVDFYCKTGLPWLVFGLPSLESGAPWYCSISNPCTHF